MNIKYRSKRIKYDDDPTCKGVADMIEVKYQVDAGETKKFALDSDLIDEKHLHLAVLYDLFKTCDFEYGHVTKPSADGQWDALIIVAPEVVATLNASG